MERIGKGFCLLLIVALAISMFIIVKFANAQSMPKPSTPEFTIQTQTKANTTTIILTIKNQPFDAASQYPNGFFYNVVVSVDGKSWSELYHVEDASEWYPQQSNSSTTVLTYVAGETVYYPRDTSQGVGVISNSGEVAFQVQAMIGHRDRGAFQNGFIPYVLVGETSDWSNTQTITLPASSKSPSPTATSSVPELSWLVIVPLLLIVFVIIMIVRLRKTANLNK
jgi:hypothetical protein